MSTLKQIPRFLYLKLYILSEFKPSDEIKFGLIVLETAKLPFTLANELNNFYQAFGGQEDANSVIQNSFEYFLNQKYQNIDFSQPFNLTADFGWTTVLEQGLIPYFDQVDQQKSAELRQIVQWRDKNWDEQMADEESFK